MNGRESQGFVNAQCIFFTGLNLVHLHIFSPMVDHHYGLRVFLMTIGQSFANHGVLASGADGRSGKGPLLPSPLKGMIT